MHVDKFSSNIKKLCSKYINIHSDSLNKANPKTYSWCGCTKLRRWAVMYLCIINVRDYRRDNQKWTLRRNWQHMVHKTKTRQINTQHTVLDTTTRKQTQITIIRHEPSYKQLEVKTSRTSFLCGNRNGLW